MKKYFLAFFFTGLFLSGASASLQNQAFSPSVWNHGDSVDVSVEETKVNGSSALNGTYSGETLHDGTINGATWTDGKYGGALSFDGTDDYVNVGAVIEPTKGISLTASIKNINTSDSSIDMLVSKNFGQDGHDLMVFDDKRIIFRCLYEDGGRIQVEKVPDTDASADQWQTVTGTCNQTNGELYINGEEVASGSRSKENLSTNNQAWRIGSDPRNSYYTDGLIDNVQIHDKYLSKSQVQKIHNDKKYISPAGYWRMDKGSGGTAFDTHNRLSRFNGDSRGSGAVSFDGTDDYTDIPDFPTNVITGNQTIDHSYTAWIRTTENEQNCVICTTGDGFDKSEFKVQNGNARMHLNDDDGNHIAEGSTTIVDGEWHLIAGTATNDKVKVYVDGNLEDTADPSNPINIGSLPKPDIGRNEGGSKYYDGSIDDLRVYNRSLSSSEISDIYQNDKPVQDGQVAWYTFDNATGQYADSRGKNVLDYDIIPSVRLDVEEAGTQIVSDAYLELQSWFDPFGSQTFDLSNAFTIDQYEVYYNATLTSEDKNGVIDSVTESQFIENVAPSASFTFTPSSPTVDQNITFDGSGSSDSDGSISSYEWDWTNDGVYEATGETAKHNYNSTGDYEAKLRVTDDQGGTSTTTETVSVSINQTNNKNVIQSCATDAKPFCTKDTNPVQVSGSVTSLDSQKISWEVNATGTNNVYSVFGFANSTSDRIGRTFYTNSYDWEINSSTPNENPNANFSTSTSDLTVDVDASDSFDRDGSISSYQWDWTFDGSYDSTGQTASHTYNTEGTFDINLKVTDDDGATDTLTKTVSVSESTSGGGGGGGGSDGDSTNDTTNNTADSISVDGTKATLQAPHLKTRYFGKLVNVSEGKSTTELTCLATCQETTYELNSVDSNTINLSVDGVSTVLDEGETEAFNGRDHLVADVVDAPNGSGSVALSKADFTVSNPEVYFSYNYTINESGSIELLYRKTGTNTWSVKDTVSSSSSVTNTYIEATQNLTKSTYETALRVNKSGTSNISQPVGFYVGQVPDIEILRPEDKLTYWAVRGSNEVQVPLDFRSYVQENGSVTFGQYYEDVDTGTRYQLGDIEGNRTVNDDDKSFFYELKSFFEENWYTTEFNGHIQLYNFLTAPQDVTYYQNTSMYVPGAGEYTGYVNYTDNSTNYDYTGTSIGKRLTVKETSPGNKNYEDNYVPQRDADTEHSLNATNVSERQINSSLDGNSTDTDYYYNAWIDVFEPDPDQTFTLADMDTGTVSFDFDFIANSTAAVNKTVFVSIDNGTTVYNESLDPLRNSYQLTVGGQDLPDEKWEEAEYTVYGKTYYSNGSAIETVRLDDYKFTVQPAGLKDLASRWFDPVLEGLTTVYDVTSSYALFIVAMVITIGWYAGFKIRENDYLAKFGAALWFAGFWWYGAIPSNVQAFVLGLAVLTVTIKLWRGEVTL